MNVLCRPGGCRFLGTSSTLDLAQVAELGALLLELLGGSIVAVVIVAAVLGLVVRVLGGHDLLVLDGLHGAVVVVLVDVLVDLGGVLLVLHGLDRLVLDGGGLALVHRGAALALLRRHVAARLCAGGLEAASLTRAALLLLAGGDVALESLADFAEHSAG